MIAVFLILLVLIFLGLGIYFLSSRLEQGGQFSVSKFENTMRKLRNHSANKHVKEPNNREAIWSRKYFGLPPLSIVAGAFAGLFIVFALAAGIMLLVNSPSKLTTYSPGKAKNPSSTTSSTLSSTTTTTLQLSPASTSANSAYFNKPSGTYEISITVQSMPTWIEVTNNYTSANATNVVAKTVNPGQSVSATLQGSAKIILGKPDVTVKINNKLVQITNPTQITEILFG